MNLFRRIFSRAAKQASAPKPPVNEDEGYTDHMVGQTQGPFYCGTAFCGHATKKAARACWKKKCDAIDAIRAEAKLLHDAGKHDEAFRMEQRRTAVYYPENNPANWPVNRPMAALVQEYKERAEKERLEE